MTEIDLFAEERIIGQKAILGILGELYGLQSWTGALEFISKYNLPLRRTPSGKPMFLRSELMLYEAQYQNQFIKSHKKV